MKQPDKWELKHTLCYEVKTSHFKKAPYWEYKLLDDELFDEIKFLLSKAFKAGVEEGKAYQGKNKRVWYSMGVKDGRKTTQTTQTTLQEIKKRVEERIENIEESYLMTECQGDGNSISYPIRELLSDILNILEGGEK